MTEKPIPCFWMLSEHEAGSLEYAKQNEETIEDVRIKCTKTGWFYIDRCMKDDCNCDCEECLKHD